MDREKFGTDLAGYNTKVPLLTRGLIPSLEYQI